MDDLTRYFAADYYPLSDNDEEKAMKYMKLAYTISEEQEQYIKDNYKERLN